MTNWEFIKVVDVKDYERKRGYSVYILKVLHLIYQMMAQKTSKNEAKKEISDYIPKFLHHIRPCLLGINISTNVVETYIVDEKQPPNIIYINNTFYILYILQIIKLDVIRDYHIDYNICYASSKQFIICIFSETPQSVSTEWT